MHRTEKKNKSITKNKSYVMNAGDMPIHTRTKDSHQSDLGMGVHTHNPLPRKPPVFGFAARFFYAHVQKREAQAN